MIKKLIQFFRNYYLFGIAVLALFAGLALQFTSQHTAMHWLLGAVALGETVPLVWGMWQDLRDGTYGIDILAATAIVSAVLFKQYWAAIVIVIMLTGGEALEDYAENRAKTELDVLLSKAPSQAHVIRGQKTLDIAVSAVKAGDKLIIKPGEVVPVDAIVLDGSASFDESSLTGESLPQLREPGGQLLSGSFNLDGAVTVKALRAAADSQYEQIIKLVRAASNSQTPFVRLADRYSVPFTIVAFVIAIGAWVMSGQSVRFLEVLVVATPCPLILAAPIAVISGMSRAAKHGIIVKNGGALERLAEVQTFAFDKTGTLTEGKLKVDKVIALGKLKKDEVLSLAAALEQNSNHVLAHAVLEAAKHQKVKVPKAKNVHEEPGKGLKASVAGREILVGRINYLVENDINIPKKISNGQKTAFYIAAGGELVGTITFEDTLRAESKQTIKALHDEGIDTLMITGDNQSAAQAVAKQLGIDHIHAESLPGGKLRVLEEITKRPVAFVGDGVNDAPVLTASDIGIALGARGETAASESADMVIMLDDISRVTKSFEIAKRTFSIARQSILVGILLSIILMFIFATGHFRPLYGAIIQEGVDVIVIFNALRAHTGGHKIAQ